MNKIILALVIITAGLLLFIFMKNSPQKIAGVDPLNTSYQIEDKIYKLENGRSEKEAAPGSASKIITEIFGQPVYRDLDGDGNDDAGVILAQTTGGNGTFYYAAAALKNASGYVGTNAILLGDRIAPQTIEVKNGILIANYAARNPGEPMTAQPSVSQSKYAYLSEKILKEISGFSAGEQLWQGSLVAAHEVRTFAPCEGAATQYWIMGDSPALPSILIKYQKEAAVVSPYAQISATIVGKITPAPTDGFGADYEHGINISQLVSLSAGKNCKSDLISVDSPKSGSPISSPLIIAGRARGSWFFEGSFPIILVDWAGRVIAQTVAQAQGEWITEKFVPFTATLSFEKPKIEARDTEGSMPIRKTLIFKKDNPSGLPEHDDQLEIPVIFG